jgi:hypothetical protein
MSIYSIYYDKGDNLLRKAHPQKQFRYCDDVHDGRRNWKPRLTRNLEDGRHWTRCSDSTGQWVKEEVRKDQANDEEEAMLHEREVHKVRKNESLHQERKN